MRQVPEVGEEEGFFFFFGDGWGMEGARQNGVDINLSPAAALSPSRPHGRLECMENTSDGVAQTKHTLCW